MNPGVPLKETTSWMVYTGDSISQSLLASARKGLNQTQRPTSSANPGYWTEEAELGNRCAGSMEGWFAPLPWAQLVAVDEVVPQFVQVPQ